MIEILYADAHIVVCVKPVGILSQDAQQTCVPQLLRQQFPGKNVYCVHRLDKAVGGVMVYALTPRAAAGLSRTVQDKTLEKTYFSVLRGVPEQQGVLEDLLFHDKMKNKTYIVDRMRKGVKDAKLTYCSLDSRQEQTLVCVRLYTGRTHQIRVQFAGRNLPLIGDGKYGGKQAGTDLALWSCALKFPHPVTGKIMKFFKRPPELEPWTSFDDAYYVENQTERECL